MKKSLVTAGISLLLVSTAFSSVHAEERWPRWYVGLSGGYTYMNDQDITGSATVSKISLQNGYGYGASLGYLPSSSSPILNAMRFELEVTHHTADVDQVKVSGVNVVGHGNYASTAYMVNAFYDWQTSSAWSPYVGAGMGVATVHLSTNSGAGNTETENNEFAYQALVGVGYAPSCMPNTQWTIGYRYLATTDVSLSGSGANNLKAGYSSNSIEVGAKFRF